MTIGVILKVNGSVYLLGGVVVQRHIPVWDRLLRTQTTVGVFRPGRMREDSAVRVYGYDKIKPTKGKS